ncbi:MAG: hypothetical protein ACTSRP_01500 [Candidatus Helarchaeota archaeon]
MVKLRLLCDTNPMCYGSSSALLAILSNLNADITVLINSLTEEIIASDPNNYKMIKVKLKDPYDIEKKVNLKKFDAVLVISNTSNLDLYFANDLPVFFVDLHYWYKTKKSHHVWTKAIKCFVEKFPGVQERINQEYNNKPEPLIVGPIIRPEIINRNSLKKEKFILINIGGAESRWIKPGVNSNYLKIIIEIILSIKSKLLDNKIFIAAGKSAIQSINKNDIPKNIILKTFPQIEFFKKLWSCNLYITSPGLNAVMEAIHYNKPMIFLPPQNASQILQLQIYEQEGLVPRGLNFPELLDNFKLPENYLDEKELTFKVLKALKLIEKSTLIKNKIKNHIIKQFDYINSKQYSESFINFKRKLWPLGAKVIADFIINWWNSK